MPRFSSYFERARKHASNFHYAIEPYSLHELNSITRKMAFLQLARSGALPISWKTLARVWDVKNFGFDPKDNDPDSPTFGRPLQTEFELWLAQQEIMARIAQAHGGGPGGPGGPGRKPSGQELPSLAQKGGGLRSTIRESKK